jgi:1-acyl-sn-glycerol-3-phosphate acyltransferase
MISAYKNAAICTISFLLTAVGILCIQFPFLPLFVTYLLCDRLNFTKTAIVLHRIFRSYIRFTEFIFGCYIVCLIWATTSSELVITGDLSVMASQHMQIVMANHQIYPDWLYMWTLARIAGKSGDVKILLMSILRYIPFCGPGMMFFEFIFMDRKWSKDKDRISKYLKRVVNDKLPIWLLIFPEGATFI